MDLLIDLYADCGLTVRHIELPTGRPAATVGALLHVGGIPLRPRGGRPPFMRRWREARTSATQLACKPCTLLANRYAGSVRCTHAGT